MRGDREVTYRTYISNPKLLNSSVIAVYFDVL